jgi:hypothetical protein
MTTKTYSIKELCARLGLDMKRYTKFEVVWDSHIDELMAVQDDVLRICILKERDLFPTDECETCSFTQKEHDEVNRTPWLDGFLVESPYYKEVNGKLIHPCFEFKPKYRKVVGIKLVERCENCNYTTEQHQPQSFTEKKKCPSKLKYYKPVQEVEITYEVE